jgi:ubiquitin-protein ligase
MQELKGFRALENEGFAAESDPNNILSWTARVRGTKGSPWERGIFNVALTFSESYPRKPPTVQFLPPIPPARYVSGSSGTICVDFLKNGTSEDAWPPWGDVVFVLTTLRLFVATNNGASEAVTKWVAESLATPG